MRILVDECVDPRVKRLFADHEIATVHEDQFDVLLTVDRSLEFQQDVAKFKIGVVVVHVPKNQIPHYAAIQKELLLAVEQLHQGEVRHVERPTYEPRNCTTE
jgi:hypothetical protein